mmetsp:Transcript_27691/g.84519  ORF Transcript_27691/g.84519 Transcript_27691/m.84519 type:complete len:122 (+) Transcript_27691:1009-1374(+)
MEYLTTHASSYEGRGGADNTKSTRKLMDPPSSLRGGDQDQVQPHMSGFARLRRARALKDLFPIRAQHETRRRLGDEYAVSNAPPPISLIRNSALSIQAVKWLAVEEPASLPESEHASSPSC